MTSLAFEPPGGLEDPPGWLPAPPPVDPPPPGEPPLPEPPPPEPPPPDEDPPPVPTTATSNGCANSWLELLTGMALEEIDVSLPVAGSTLITPPQPGSQPPNADSSATMMLPCPSSAIPVGPSKYWLDALTGRPLADRSVSLPVAGSILTTSPQRPLLHCPQSATRMLPSASTARLTGACRY